MADQATLEFYAIALVAASALLGALTSVWIDQAHEAYLVREQGGNSATGVASAGSNFHAIQTSAMGGRIAAATIAMAGTVACMYGATRAFMSSRNTATSRR